MKRFAEALILVVLLGLVWIIPAYGLIYLATFDTQDQSAGFVLLLYVFWPAVACFFLFMWSIELGLGRILARRGQRMPVKHPLTIWLLTFYFLPIALSGLSRVFKVLGWQTGAEFALNYRWLSPWLLVLGSFGALMTYVVVSLASDTLGRIRRHLPVLIT